MKEKKAQVWVETVIYTLIGLTVIGILLGFSKPKIDSMKDKIIIEQTIDLFERINSLILDVQTSTGNKRIAELKISDGKFSVLPDEDLITWEMTSAYKYSEPGLANYYGKMIILTEGTGPYKVSLTLNYSFLSLTNSLGQEDMALSRSPVPYKLSIENIGIRQGESKQTIDFSAA